MDTRRVGRNAPCGCGSGKKYKFCCYRGAQSLPRFSFPPSRGRVASLCTGEPQFPPNRLAVRIVPDASGSPPPRWNEVIFDAPLADGGRLHAVLLYSDAGLRLSPFRRGGVFTLDLPDIPFRGPATVVRIQPSRAGAEVEAEALRVVRFRHDDDLGTPLYGDWDPPPEFVEGWRRRRREVGLRLEYPDGGWCDIRLIRTVEWIAEAGAQPGATIFLDPGEVGTRGWAKVIEVLPCGPVEIGPGDLITGTFRHSHGQIGELILESEPEPLGVTPGHLFWSEDRQAWVPVGGLRRGETLRTMKGVTRVVSYTLTDRVEPVYNIEVEGSHCYRVGESGVLVHNNSAGAGSTCDCRLQGYQQRWSGNILSPLSAIILHDEMRFSRLRATAGPTLWDIACYIASARRYDDTTVAVAIVCKRGEDDFEIVAATSRTDSGAASRARSLSGITYIGSGSIENNPVHAEEFIVASRNDPNETIVAIAASKCMCHRCQNATSGIHVESPADVRLRVVRQGDERTPSTCDGIRANRGAFSRLRCPVNRQTGLPS